MTTTAIKTSTKSLRDNYSIDPELYGKYEVHRGLRKPNGTGVLTGLTRVGDVHGYEMVDGVKTAVPGALFYRGYDMSAIAKAAWDEKRFAFEEIIHLLMLGNLPTTAELDTFTNNLRTRMALPTNFLLDSGLRMPSPSVMNKLAVSILGLYAYDLDADSQDLETVFDHCLDIIMRFPILLVHAYKAKHYKLDTVRAPKPTLSFAENFLYMLRDDGKFTDIEARILDLSLVLHAEHGGGNNSTFSVHVISSTGTDTYSAISAAVGSLKGKKHGGANGEVRSMMREIMANVKDWKDETEVRSYLAKIIRKEAGDGSGLIYGLGHAVYTVTDPRAEMFKERASLLAKEKGRDAEMDLYLLVAEVAPEVFAEVKGSDKRMCTNVDFFTGFIYEMLGIPEELCTPIFAMSRVVGWCAHRIDELVNGGRIIRPAYKDVGDRKNYLPILLRKGETE